MGERINAPSTFANKTDAMRRLAAVGTDIGRGEWHDPRSGDRPYSEWADQWLAVKEPKLAGSTVDLYRYAIDRLIAPTFGDTPVGRITAADVQSWLAELHRTGLSPNTVAKAYRVPRGRLDAAVDAGLIKQTPCRVKGAGTERTREMLVATPEQVVALVDAAGPRWEALIYVAAYCGLRWGELAGLRRCDVAPDGATIRATRKLAEVNGRLSFGPPKTAAGRRTSYLERFGERPPVAATTADQPPDAVRKGHVVGTPPDLDSSPTRPELPRALQGKRRGR